MSEHSSSLAVLLKRLEAATSRLEELALTKNKSGNNSSLPNSGRAGLPPSSGGSVESELPEFINGYETIVVPSINNYLDLSSKVGDVVLEQSKVVKELLLNHLRKFLQLAAKAKKPSSQDQLAQLFHPSQAALEGLMKHVEANRPSPLFNHLSTVSSGIPAVSWVIVEPDTATCVKELLDSSQFYAHRVIKAFKEGDHTHVDWANSFVEMLKQLHAYVEKYHKTGLTWNPKGADATSLPEGSSNSARPSPPPKPATLRSNNGGAPPPPPPPAVLDVPSLPSGPSSVFNEINKGDAITAGLKKVDKSQMTHKNPALRREGSPEPTSVTPPTRSSARPSAKSNKEGETRLEGHKWLVQNHVGGTVVVEPTELKQVVYIYNSNGTTVQIKGKCNGVVVDSCKKSGIVLDTAMASVDIINCTSCQVQVLQTTPTVVIDKTDGLQLYLSSECLGVEILTAKSSQINILLPPAKEEDDYVERAVPEQFKTTIVDGKIITVPMEHE